MSLNNVIRVQPWQGRQDSNCLLQCIKGWTRLPLYALLVWLGIITWSGLE